MHRAASRTALVVAIATMAPRAVAQPNVADAARAEALFQESKTLIDAGDYTRACPKLRESYRLDPAAGTLLALALCHEREGKTATAYAEFKQTVALARKAGRADREKLGQEHIAVLEPLLSRLTIRVPADGPSDIVVKRDGALVDRREWDVPVPVDPGIHVVEAAASGKRPFTKTIQIDGASQVRVLTVAMEDERAVAAAPKTPDASGETGDGDGDGRRTAGFVVGGVGLVALGLGTVFGIRALSKSSDAKEVCPRPSACTNAAAVELADDATTAANVSNIGLVVGVAAVGIGAYLVLSSGSTGDGKARSQVSIAPAATRDGGGFALTGQWF